MHDKFLKTRWQHGFAALVSFGAAYSFISRAFDSGSYWYYLAVLILLVFGVICTRHALLKAPQ